jgi:hypothetical protein
MYIFSGLILHSSLFTRSPLLHLCIGKSTMVGSLASPQNSFFGSLCLSGMDCGLHTTQLLLANTKPCSHMTSLYVAQTG